MNNYNPRNIAWRVRNMDININAFKFEGNSEFSQETLNLETPFQFSSYFFNGQIFKFLVDESNKYTFQKNPNFTERVTIQNYESFSEFLFSLVLTIILMSGHIGQTLQNLNL